LGMLLELQCSLARDGRDAWTKGRCENLVDLILKCENDRIMAWEFLPQYENGAGSACPPEGALYALARRALPIHGLIKCWTPLCTFVNQPKRIQSPSPSFTFASQSKGNYFCS
jgi:hypothetical protein